MIFEYKTRVDIGKVNANAEVTNKGMLALLENVACMHSDKAGFGIREIPTTHLSWVQLNWRVHIIRRLKYGEEITIRTWARDCSRAITLRDFEVLDNEGKTVCIATTRWTLTNIDTQSITKITEDIIREYDPETYTIMPDFEFKKLKEPEISSNEYVYTTQRRDIDVNKHMHNLNYLDLAYEALPGEIYDKVLKGNDFNNIEVMYKTAIRLGDTSKCLYSYIEGKHIVIIKSIDDKTLHCIVELW